MKVAVNTRMLLPDRMEGIGWFTHEVTRRLVRRHPDWKFLFLFDRSFDPSFVYADNVEPLVVGPQARHPLLWYAWFEHALPKVFGKHRPDVFFSPDGYLSLRTDVPTALVLHDIAWAHFPEQVPLLVRNYYRRFVPRFAHRAGALLTVSEYSRQDIARELTLPAERISVCGNGARPGFKPLEETEKETVRREYADGQDYFFYVGSVHPRKNLDRLIRAFDQFKRESRSPVKLLLAGAEGWRSDLVRQAHLAAAFRDDIHFLGYLDEAELPRILGAARALCYVSLFEGFGLPILEAMHAEVPVICSRTSSMPEIAGEAAWLVDPESVESMAGALRKIHDDAGMRKGLVEAGRRQRERFSWASTVAVIESSLLGLEGSPASI